MNQHVQRWRHELHIAEAHTRGEVARAVALLLVVLGIFAVLALMLMVSQLAR